VFRSATGFHIPTSKVCQAILRNDLLCRLSFEDGGLSCSGRQQLVPLPLQKHRVPYLTGSGAQRSSSFLPLPAAWEWVRDGWLAGAGSQGGQPHCKARRTGDASWDGAGGVRDAGARRSREPLRMPGDIGSGQGIP